MTNSDYLDLINSIDRLASSVARLEERLERIERSLRLPTPEEMMERAHKEGIYWDVPRRERPAHAWCPANTSAANPNYAQL